MQPLDAVKNSPERRRGQKEPNQTETKRNEMKRNETKRNETKRNETKRNDALADRRRRRARGPSCCPSRNGVEGVTKALRSGHLAHSAWFPSSSRVATEPVQIVQELQALRQQVIGNM